MIDEKVHVLDHPLLQHKLSILRDERTGVKEFREIVSEIAALECYEATRDLPLEDVVIKTVEEGQMTKDLAMLIGPDQPWLDTEGFMDALDENLAKALAE